MRLIKEIVPGVGLRQGDLLDLSRAENIPYGARLGVIVTADCDLAQDKHYGQILLCPIVPASTYYQHIWCAKRLDGFREKTLKRLRKEFDELSARGVLNSPLSDDAISAICESEVAIRVSLQELGLACGKIEELARAVASLELCAGVDGPLISLVAATAYSQKKEVAEIKKKLFSDFKAELGKDAIDVVAVHDDLTGDDIVHVVLLRAPFSVAIQNVGFSGRDKSAAAILRIGSFAPEIKFLVTQKFGTLFSRVGMKSEIEVDRNAAIDLLEDPS